MQLCGEDAVSVLMACYNPHISQELHFALGTMNAMTNAPPIQFKSVTILKHTVPYS